MTERSVPPDPPRIGFAAMWAPRPRTTWSGTPWSLMQSLRARTPVVDLGVHPSPVVRSAFKAAHVRRHDGRFVTAYKHADLWQGWVERSLRRSLRDAPVDAVVEIGDLAVVDRPFLLYQDLSYDAVLDAFDDEAGAALHFPGLSRDDLLRCRDRQHRIYDAAAGVLTMSRWLAERLVASGVPAGKVHVVPPGIEAPTGDGGRGPSTRLHGPRRRLLFVGRDFHTKAGDVVVAALARLRHEFDPTLTLTIAGPPVWPLAGPVPAGVDWLGPVPAERVGDLYHDHDLLVMPSRLEGFGKVFAEARCAGLPSIARRAYAMPELIIPGEHGALVDDDDVGRLCEAIVSVLTDDELYARCEAGRAGATAYFTWSRAADDVLRAVAGCVGPPVVPRRSA
jgi:glycosyltransferase involved in cell wall biosynthesis